jgi:hypothetical protein
MNVVLDTAACLSSGVIDPPGRGLPVSQCKTPPGTLQAGSGVI